MKKGLRSRSRAAPRGTDPGLWEGRACGKDQLCKCLSSRPQLSFQMCLC